MKKSENILDEIGGEREVLLHTCCAPCSSAIVEFLLKNGVRPLIYYCNPNIYPEEEYLIRKNECSRYARSLGLKIVDADYDHAAWLEKIKGLEAEPERGRRCTECFRARLISAAQYAQTHRIKYIATTLASSRWKNIEQINAAGEYAVSLFEGVSWWGRNWRKGGLQERRREIIEEMGFYNQTYCGCEFSLREAALQETACEDR